MSGGESHRVRRDPGGRRRLPTSEKALAAAVDLAVHCGADLTALGVVEIPEVVAMVDEVDEVRGGAEAQRAAEDWSCTPSSLRGHAAAEIFHYAESEGVDLIALGQRGHSRIARFLLGSTSDRVSEHCHCTVMIVE